MTKKILLPVLLIFTLVSCATKITNMDIDQTKITVLDMDGNTINRFLPDSIYNISINIIDKNGSSYPHPNYRNFKITNLKNLKISSQTFFNLRLKTGKSTFHEEGTNAYSFDISVKKNPFPLMTFDFSLDWINFDTLNFSGKNGDDGEDGENGLSASGETINHVKGSSGKNGSDGQYGLSGKNIKLLVMKYQFEDSEKILLYQINKEILILADMKTISIDTSGGNGGKGGSGGNGGYGHSYTNEVTNSVTVGIFGRPGGSGDGGRGGRGGNITLFSTDPNFFHFLNPVASGGTGGLAGRPGKNYNKVTEKTDKGKKGKKGRNGRDGEIQFEILTKNDITTILESITEEGFDISKIVY